MAPSLARRAVVAALVAGSALVAACGARGPLDTTVLESYVRDRAAGRLWRVLAELPSPLQRGRQRAFVGMVTVMKGRRLVRPGSSSDFNGI